MAIEVYLQFEHAVFELKVLFPFPLVTATCIGDYLINKRYAQNFGTSIYSRVINITYLFCPQIKFGEIIPAPMALRIEFAVQIRKLF